MGGVARRVAAWTSVAVLSLGVALPATALAAGSPSKSSGGASVSSGSSGSAGGGVNPLNGLPTTSAATTTSTATLNATSTTGSSGSSGISTGAAIGIALAGFLIIIGIGAAIMRDARRRTRSRHPHADKPQERIPGSKRPPKARKLSSAERKRRKRGRAPRR